MHELQKILLKRLQVTNRQRFSTLTSGYGFEDNVVFHLNSLIRRKYVEKDNGTYSINLKGIKEISKYEPFELQDRGAKTYFVGFVCKDEEGNYLIKSHANAKINFFNLPSGKPFFGEKIEDALVRTFEVNTGLKLEADRFKFKTLHLKTIQADKGETIFDDAFGIYSVRLIEGQKEEMNLNKSISWMSLDEIKKLDHKWPEIDMCILNKDFTVYKSYIHTSDYIL